MNWKQGLSRPTPFSQRWNTLTLAGRNEEAFSLWKRDVFKRAPATQSFPDEDLIVLYKFELEKLGLISKKPLRTPISP